MRKHFDIADQADDAPVETFDLEIPENLTDLSAEALGDLRSKAVDAFQTLYATGEFTDEDLATLGTLTDGIEGLSAEISAREQAAAERAAKAAELAAKVGADKPADDSKPAPADDDEDDTSADDADDADDTPAEKKADAAEDEAERPAAEQAQKKAKAAAADVEPAAEIDAEPEAVTAAAPRGPIKLSGIRRHVHTPAPAITEETSVEDTAKARLTVADVPGFAADSDASFEDLAVALDRRLQGFNSGAYAAAARAGRAMSERHSLAAVRKNFDERATVSSPESADAAMAFAVNEKNLPGGSLVAAGGWCAPSETVYDLLEGESRDGLISLPEINVTRGGIKFTKGPKFADLYAAPSFNFTEEEAKAGKYAPPTSATDPTNKVGPKPFYSVPCTDFEDVRLSAAGLHIQANLLQQRGYPELVARTIRGALVAHEHKMSERIIAAMEHQSTAVSMDSGQIGAAAPILTAIELQVEHYRYAQRLSRSTTLEAVFPYWVHGAIRTDLSRREGVDLIDINDARIDAWFRSRGVNPQFVYDWQALTGEASAFKAWDTSLKFLLYSAGTFVKGGQDVITLDTVYDSTLLSQNDYTALFTEEGYLVAKRGHDARVVTVPLNPNGGTGTGIKLLANGTADQAK